MPDISYASHITTPYTNAQTAITNAQSALDTAQDELDAALAADPQVPNTITAKTAALATATAALATAVAALAVPEQIYLRHKADVDAANLEAHIAATETTLIGYLAQLNAMTEAAGRRPTYRMNRQLVNYAQSGRLS